ncbi:NHLP leader peptide family natural product precursor [bacterium]|nr:NHLP leader peptide family natural product precursor [bacterium]
MSNWSTESLTQAIELFKQRAARDTEFRALALKDPGLAVKELTGAEVPEGFTINVLESQGADMTIVLPPLKADADELDESELELVTGGTSFSAFILYGPNDAPPKKKK